jgi:hypothetical protein
MADVVAAAGKAEGAAEVVDVLNSIAPVRVSVDPPFRRYVGSPSRGIDLLFDNERVISVQIYVQGTRTFSAYSDELPFGLQGAKSQADVHQVLGVPTESSNISSKYVLNERGVKVMATYDGSMNMRLLSISPLDN